ncbi:ComF family protein [Nemorincola caseinilytica]
MLSLYELRQGFTHLFYPTLCDGCRKPLVAGEQVMCIGCADQLPETGYHAMPGNETEVRFSGRIPFVWATSYAWFTTDGLLQHLLYGLKYRNRPDIGTFLGRRFAASLHAAGRGGDIDLIIPVPLHASRQADRGYNQSMVIAQDLGSDLGIPVSDTLLHRVRYTESQTSKTRQERAENMAGAFSLSDAAAISGKHILIIDDVLTTGATIEACAQALLAAAGVRISIATIGIAV